MLRIPHPFIAEKGRFLLFYLFDVRVRSQLILAHSFSLCSIFGMLPHLNHRTKFCISLALSFSHFLSGSLFRPVFFSSSLLLFRLSHSVISGFECSFYDFILSTRKRLFLFSETLDLREPLSPIIVIYYFSWPFLFSCIRCSFGSIVFCVFHSLHLVHVFCFWYRKKRFMHWERDKTTLQHQNMHIIQSNTFGCSIARAFSPVRSAFLLFTSPKKNLEKQTNSMIVTVFSLI